MPYLFALAGVAGSAPADAQSASMPARPSSASQLSSAKAVMETLRRDGFSGAVAIMQNGKLILVDAAGEAREGARFTPDTKVDVASISKPITTMAVLKLVQQRRLSLDDSIGRWFPNAPADKRPITLRQLLSHTAGIADAVEGGSDYTRITTEKAADTLLKAPLDFTPGTKYSYSNGGFVVVTAIVQKASGERLENFLQREVFGPAGVRASYDPTQFPASKVADGLAYYEGTWIKVRDMAAASKGPFGFLWGDGGLFISAPDLARLTNAFFSGRIVDPRLVEEVQHPIIKVGGPYQQGLGWIIGKTPYGPNMRHTGGANHSSSTLSYFPGSRLVFVALVNRATPSSQRAVRELAAAFLGPNAAPLPIPKSNGEVVAPGSPEAVLAQKLVGILRAPQSEKVKFIADNFTPEARANGGADSILDVLLIATKVGRPRLISVTRPASDKLEILAETFEFPQQVFWRAKLETVITGGRLLISKISTGLE